MVATTHISLHMVTSITTFAPEQVGHPLTLLLKSPYGDTNISLFFDIGDTGLAQRLAEAINAAIVGPIELPLEAACPQEEAAYQAAAMHYFATGEYRR